MTVMKWVCSCFELSNAYLHVEKDYLIEINSDSFKKSDLLQRNATYWKGILFSLQNATLFQWKCLFVKPPFVNETCLFKSKKKDACLIVFWSKISIVFTALFRFWYKTESWDFLHVGWSTRPYLRESLQTCDAKYSAYIRYHYIYMCVCACFLATCIDACIAANTASGQRWSYSPAAKRKPWKDQSLKAWRWQYGT